MTIRKARSTALATSLAVLSWSYPQGSPPCSQPLAQSSNVTSVRYRFDKPVAFDSPEADSLLETLQIFPSSNPWNEDVSRRPVVSNSRAIIASIGEAKPL